MGNDLSRFHAELHRLTSGNNQLARRNSELPMQARAVYTEAVIRGAVIDAARMLAEAASQADQEVSVSLQRSTLETTAQMEKAGGQYTSSRVQAIAEPVTDVFSQDNFAHNVAYYHAFAEQTMRQVRQEITVPPPPPPPRRRPWFLGD